MTSPTDRVPKATEFMAKLQLAEAKLHDELQPRPLDPTPFSKEGWSMRLDRALERVWVKYEVALREAMDLCFTPNPDRLIDTLARVVWERYNRKYGPEETAIIEEAQNKRLLSMMESEGLPFDMACASLGLSPKVINKRCDKDPILAARIGQAFIRGTASLHRVVWGKAKDGDTRALLRLLEIRDKSYAPTLNVDVSDRDILQSEAFKRLGPKILAVLETPPPHDAPEDGRKWWESAMETARTRFVEMCREE